MIPLIPMMSVLLFSPWTAAATLHVHVVDGGTGRPIPCRITVVDSAGKLAAVEVAKSAKLAVRPGVVYSSDGSANIGLAAGSYTVYATRGPRYSLAKQAVTVGPAGAELRLQIRREVDMGGYVSVDTHIHTLQFSGHGDSTAEERLVTLAGEEVDMPISTEHNRQVDYAPFADSTGAAAYLTPVTGNEVTTPIGHFNIFPVVPNGTPPPWESKNRAQILAEIRALPGVRIVTFNHPWDAHSGVQPDSAARFHPLSGESLDGNPWTTDAIEVINSGAQQSDWMRPFRDWFALLNSGQPIVAVGSSDSHDVNAFIVGQARTYVKSSAARPDRIDVEEACRNLKAGRALVSLGLVTEMWVNGASAVGDLATGLGGEIKVRIRVQGPHWMAADRIELYGDGALVASRNFEPRQDSVTKADITFTLPNPAHDMWLVAIATGPGPDDMTAPYWPLARPYQPTRADWQPHLIGATNPIRLDADGDGKYTSPKELASRIVDESGDDPARLVRSLSACDSAVSVQAAAVCHQRGIDLNSGAARQAVEAASPAVRQAITAYYLLLNRERE
jgi:hypothetical protein